MVNVIMRRAAGTDREIGKISRQMALSEANVRRDSEWRHKADARPFPFIKLDRLPMDL
jgi:hypothetical protein